MNRFRKLVRAAARDVKVTNVKENHNSISSSSSYQPSYHAATEALSQEFVTVTVPVVSGAVAASVTPSTAVAQAVSAPAGGASVHTPLPPAVQAVQQQGPLQQEEQVHEQQQEQQQQQVHEQQQQLQEEQQKQQQQQFQEQQQQQVQEQQQRQQQVQEQQQQKQLVQEQQQQKQLVSVQDQQQEGATPRSLPGRAAPPVPTNRLTGAGASSLPTAGRGAETAEPVTGAALQDKRTTGTPAPALTNGHSMDAPRTEAEPLRHINQLRPRGPQRRPPSSIFKENMRLSAGSNGDSSAASADPVKSDKPQSQSSTDAIDIPSTAAAAHHGGEEITSKILLRAGAPKPFTAPTTAAASTSAPSSRQVPTRPSTIMAGTNQNVPWLQELNAKQKRKSLLDSEREAAPLSPPVAAKPPTLITKPPHKPTPEVSPAKLAHESPDKPAHELPPAVKIVELSPVKPAQDLHPAKPSIDSSLSKPLSDGTPSHSLQDEPSVKPHSKSTHKIREHTHSESRSRRTTLDEPDAASSASSSRKSSSGSVRPAAEGAAPHAQVSSGSEGDQVVALSNTAVSSSTSQSSLLSSEYSLLSSQSPQPSLAPAHAPSTAGQAGSTSPPNSPLHDLHPPPGAAHDSSRLPNRPDDAAAALETLLPKVLLLEEQHRSHTRQLLALTEELDEERKKRACLEIEMERLRKVLMTRTAAV